MFTPFQRLGDTDNTTGTGLGLALSRGLTEAMGGQLIPEETPGGGLTMVIQLRTARAPGEPFDDHRDGDLVTTVRRRRRTADPPRIACDRRSTPRGADHAERVVERADGFRALLENLLSVQNSLVAQQQNDEMRSWTMALRLPVRARPDARHVAHDVRGVQASRLVVSR